MNIPLALGDFDVTQFSDGRYHFRIFEEDDKLYIQDMGSQTGTFINDRGLPGFVMGDGSTPYLLPARCRIKAGTAEMVFEMVTSPEESENTERQQRQIKRLLSKGVFLTSRKRYDDAIAAFEKVLSWDPENHFAWYLKALAYAGMGSKDMSRHCMEMAKWFHSEQNKRSPGMPESPKFMDIGNEKELAAIFEEGESSTPFQDDTDKQTGQEASETFKQEVSETFRDEAPETFRDEAPETFRDEAPETFRDEVPTFRDEVPTFRDEVPTFRDEGPETFRDEVPETFRDEAPFTAPGEDFNLDEIEVELKRSTVTHQAADIPWESGSDHETESALLAIYSDHKEEQNIFPEIYKERIDKVEADTIRIREVGVNVSAADALVVLARDKLMRMEFDDVEIVVTEAEELVENVKNTQVKEIAAENLLRVQEIFTKMKENNMKIERERSILREIVMAFREEDYIHAGLLCIRTKDELLKLQEKLSDRDEAASILKEVQTIIGKAEFPGDLLKPITDMTQEAVVNINDGNFREAREIANNILIDLNELIKSSFEENLKTLSHEVNLLFKKAKKLGIAMDGVPERLTDAYDLEREGEFGKAIRDMESIKATLSKMIYESVHIAREQDVEKAVKELKTLQEDNDREYDDLYYHLNNASEALEAEDYEKVDNHLDKFYRDMEERIKKQRIHDYSTEIERIRSDLEFIKSIGIDVGSAESVLEGGSKYLDRGEMDEMEEAVKRAEISIQELNARKVKDKARRLFPKTKDLITRMEQAGEDVKEEKKKMDIAIKAFRKKDYITTCRFCMEARSRPLELEEGLMDKEQTIAILGEVGALIRKEITHRLSLTPIEEMIREAAIKLKTRRYEEAKTIATKALDKLTEMIEFAYIEREARLWKDVNTQLERAKRLNIKVDDFKGELSHIRKLKKEERLEEAVSRLESFRSSSTEVILERLQNSRRQLIDRAERELTELQKETSGKYDDLRSCLDVAREALELRDFENVDGYLEEFFMFKEEYSNKFFLRTYSAKIRDIQSKVDIIRDLGINVGSYEKLFPPRDGTLIGDDLEGVKKRFFELSGIIDNMNDNEIKRMAKKLFPKTKQLLNRVEKKGGKVTGEKEIIGRAIKMFREKKYIETCKLCFEANERLEKVYKALEAKEEAITIFKRIKETVKNAPLSDIQRGSIGDMIQDGRVYIKKGKYIKAYHTAKKTDKRLAGILETMDRRKLEILLNEVIRHMEKAEKIGLNVSDFSGKLREAQALKEEREYNEAISRLESLKSSLTQLIYEDVHLSRERRIENARNEKKSIEEETGLRYGDLQSCLDTAQEALDERDYDKTDGYLEEFYMFRDEYLRRFYLDNYETKIERMEREIVLIRELGLDVSSSEKLIAQVKDSFDREDFTEVKKRVKKAENMLTGIKNERLMKMAKEYFPELKNLLHQVQNKGNEAKKEKEMIKEALKAYRNKDYITTLRLCSEIKVNLSNALTGIISQEEDTRRKKDQRAAITAVLNEAKRMILEAAELGLDVGTVREHREKSRTYLDMERFEDSMKHAEKARSALEKMINEKLTDILEDKLEEFNEIMKKAKEIGMDTKNEDSEFNEMVRLRNEGRYGESINSMEDILASLYKKLRIHKKGLRFVKVVKAERELQTLEREIGEILSEPRAYLTNAKKDIEAENFEAVDKFLEKFAVAKEKGRERYFVRKQSQEIQKMEKEKWDLKDIGINVEDIDRLLSSAKENIRERDFKSSAEFLGKVRPLFQEARTTSAEKLAEQLMSGTEKIIKDMNASGIDVQTGMERLAEARIMAEQWKFVKSCQIVLSLKDEFKKIEADHFMKNFPADRGEIDEMIEEGRKLGVNTAVIEEQMTTVQSYYDRKRYKDAYSIMQRAKGLIQELFRKELAGSIKAELAYVNANMEEAQKLGINVGGEIEKLKAVNELEKEGRYWLVSQGLKTLVASLNDKIIAGLKERNARRIEEARKELIVFRKEAGRDFGDLKKLLDDAERLQREDDHDALDETLETFHNIKKRFERNVFTKMLTEKTDKLREEIMLIKGLGMDVRSAEKAMLSIRESISKSEFEKARESISHVMGFLKTVRTITAKKIAKREVENTLKLYGLLSKTGMALEDEKAMLDDVMKAVNKAEYIECIRLTTRLKDVLLTTREQYFKKKTSTYLSEDREKLEKAREIGVDTKGIEEMMKKAWELLENGKNRDAMVLALDARDRLKEIVVSESSFLFEEKISYLELAMDEAKDRGLNINAEKKALGKIMSIKEDERSQETLNEIDRLKASLKKRTEDHRRKIYEMRLRDIGGGAGGKKKDEEKDEKKGKKKVVETVRVTQTTEEKYVVAAEKAVKESTVELHPVDDAEKAEIPIAETKPVRSERTKVDPRKIVANLIRPSKAAAEEAPDKAGTEGEVETDEEGTKEDAETDGKETEEEEDVSRLEITPEQKDSLKNANKNDIGVIKMMLNGNVFRRVYGGKYKVFSKGINNKMDLLVRELRYNNPELSNDDIVDELSVLFVK